MDDHQTTMKIILYDYQLQWLNDEHNGHVFVVMNTDVPCKRVHLFLLQYSA